MSHRLVARNICSSRNTVFASWLSSISSPRRCFPTNRMYSSDCVGFPGLPDRYSPAFSFWPTFLSQKEQSILLSAALQKLDSQDSASTRKKRAKMMKERNVQRDRDDSIQGIFAKDELYDFYEGHYDGVIHHYREMHLTAWPDVPGLPEILRRLHSLCPSPEIQTHLLHLASFGDILPHVDNVEASGTWILGVSLGDERTLRIEPTDEAQSFEMALPSGSVYLQRDAVRYNFKHSIIRRAESLITPTGQRMSVLFRDLPSSTPIQ